MPDSTQPDLNAFFEEIEALKAEMQRLKDAHPGRPGNLLNVTEAAKFLKVTKQTLYQYLHRGTIKAYTPKGFNVLILRAELERYLSEKPPRAKKKKAQPPRRAL